MNERTASRFEL